MRTAGMVNALILAVLPEGEGTMAGIMERLKQFLYLMFLCVFLLIVFMDFRSICEASQKLLQRASSVTSLEVASIKMNFSPDTVETVFSDLKLDNDVDAAQKTRALDLIHDLDPQEFLRLMYVGQLDGLCEFDHPTTQMRFDVATDHRLSDKQLTKIVDSPDILAQTTQYLKQQADRGEVPEHGYPRNCYVMLLTPDGYNVKTALVGTFGSAFKGSATKRTAPDTLVASQ
jgi:hypothetical protein